MTISSSFRFRRDIGPSSLQMGQFSNLGWQSSQTTCLLRHWYIGTESIVWKQTGHSRRSLKRFSFHFSIFKDKLFYFQWHFVGFAKFMGFAAKQYWSVFVQPTRWESKAKILKVNYFSIPKRQNLAKFYEPTQLSRSYSSKYNLKQIWI